MKERIAALEQRFRGVTIIVGVDRLDYIKGVPQKLHALELFLTQHPEWIGKVNFEILIPISDVDNNAILSMRFRLCYVNLRCPQGKM